MRKTLKVTVLLVSVIIFLASISEALTSVAGTYVNEKDNELYIELKADGKFFIKDCCVQGNGQYEIEENIITLKMDSGLTSKGTIQENAIIDPDGDRWIKQKNE